MPKVPESYLQARRNEILDAAWRCFTRRGFHQATMQDICRESGMSPGAVYRYFGGKMEIIEAVQDRETEQQAALIAAMRATAPDILRALESIGYHYFGRLVESDFQAHSRLTSELWAETLRNEAARAVYRRYLGHFRETLAALFSEGMKEATTPASDVDPEAMANLVFALYQGLEMCKAVDPEGVDTNEVFRVLYRLATGRFPERPSTEPPRGSARAPAEEG
jgi:AcrR family transcriptional regulator